MSGTFDVDIFFFLLPRSRTDTLLREKKSSVSLDGILAKPTRPSRGNQLRGDYQKTVFVSTETPLRKSEKRSRAIPLIDRRVSRPRAIPLIDRLSGLPTRAPDSGLPMRNSPSTSDVRSSSEPIAITKEHFCKT